MEKLISERDRLAEEHDRLAEEIETLEELATQGPRANEVWEIEDGRRFVVDDEGGATCLITGMRFWVEQRKLLRRVGVLSEVYVPAGDVEKGEKKEKILVYRSEQSLDGFDTGDSRSNSEHRHD